MLADKINEDAVPAERVSGNQLEHRVRYKEGKDKIGNSNNKSDSEKELMIRCMECGDNALRQRALEASGEKRRICSIGTNKKNDEKQIHKNRKKAAFAG